jgi:hypothetical protein
MACVRAFVASSSIVRRTSVLAPVAARAANAVLMRMPIGASPSWAPASHLSTETTTESVQEDSPGYTVEDVELPKDDSLRVVWYKQKNVPGSVKKLNVVARQVRANDSKLGIWSSRLRRSPIRGPR